MNEYKTWFHTKVITRIRTAQSRAFIGCELRTDSFRIQQGYVGCFESADEEKIIYFWPHFLFAF